MCRLYGGERINQVDVKRFYETFLARLQRMVDSDYHASASMLEIYQGLPAVVDAYMMPNGGVVGLMKLGATENRVEVFSGDYEQISTELRNRTFDYLLPIYPSHPTSNEEIDAIIKHMLETRLREIDFAQYLKDVVLGIVNIEGQITEISKTNPWLSRQFGELTTMLSDTRKAAEDVSSMAKDSQERLRYDGYDELVGFLETYDPATSPQRLDSVDTERVRTFVTGFIRSYRATIDAKSLTKEAYPPFYADYPYNVNLVLLPNKNVALFFSKATEGMRFNDQLMGFTEFENEYKNRGFDYFLGLPNAIPLDKQNAVHHAQIQAQIDLDRHELIMALGRIPRALTAIEQQIIKIKKSNPWLEQNLSELLRTLETCDKPVSKLLDRVEKQRKAGVILRSYLNPFDASICIFPTSGAVPAPPVYEDVETAQPTTVPGAFVPSTGASITQAYEPPGVHEVHPPGAAADAAAAVPTGAAAGTYESADLNEIRSMLYTFERKLSDYEKRLHYIDKYTEMIQRQQNKKFKAQKELLTLETRKGRWLSLGVGVAGLAIAAIVLILNREELVDLLSGLF